MPMMTCDAAFFPDDLRQAAKAKEGAALTALGQVERGEGAGGTYTGWFDWPRRKGFALGREIEAFASRLDPFYDTVLVIGIGGSYLGTRAIAECLGHAHGPLLATHGHGRPMVTYAGHHLSERALIETLDLLDGRQPIVNVISKSGTTTEPAAAFRVIRAYMERRYGKDEASQRIIATTDRTKGALRRLADDAGYATFEVPDDVGGRFSVLTSVGLVPLALAGYDIEALLTGADQMFASLKAKAAEHPAIQYATLRHAAFAAGKRIELLSYAEPRMSYMVEWWKQLFGESEGKDGKGLFPAGLAYTTDLHSLGQYAQDGVRNLIETFLVIGDGVSSGEPIERRLKIPTLAGNADELGYLEGQPFDDINRAALDATKVAHADGGVPCLSLALPSLDEQSLGYMVAFFETACAVSGHLLGVNPFDQPGVETYKKNLFGLLGKPGFEALGTDVRRRLKG